MELKIGMTVKSFLVIGVIGEISGESVYIWQNTHRGAFGMLDPKSKGFKYSWVTLPQNIKVISEHDIFANEKFMKG